MSEAKMREGLSVGDKVAVYGLNDFGPERIVAVVQPNDRAFGLRVKVLSSGGESRYVHPKQCRRLVKKPRRSVWIYPKELALAGKASGVFYTDSSNGTTGAIEFREVKRGKN